MTKKVFRLNHNALTTDGWLRTRLQQCTNLKNAGDTLMALANIPTTGKSLAIVQRESGLSKDTFEQNIIELIRAGVVSYSIPKTVKNC